MISRMDGSRTNTNSGNNTKITNNIDGSPIKGFYM